MASPKTVYPTLSLLPEETPAEVLAHILLLLFSPLSNLVLPSVALSDMATWLPPFSWHL